MTDSNQSNPTSSAPIDYTTPSPRFSARNEDAFKDAMAYLDENGYVVISDVMNEGEIKMNKDLLWNYVESATDGRILRNDPQTWSNAWPSFGTHGVLSGHGVGQSDFLWNVRSHPQVKKVFTQVWNDPRLLVSFDGCGVFRDWRYNPIWKTNGGWNHVDQNPKVKPDRCCIQGFVSLTDQNETSGGLIVYPKSYLRFPELSDVVKNTNDYVKVTDTHPIMSQDQTRGKLVHCRAGDLVLWDSRTIHCNTPATAIEARDKDEPVDLIRIVAYVCMSPVSQIPVEKLEEFREKRKQLVEDNCTSTHWSTELRVSAGVNTGLPKVSLDKFNVYQKALILGYDHAETQ